MQCRWALTFRVRRELIESAGTLRVKQRFGGNAYAEPDLGYEKAEVRGS